MGGRTLPFECEHGVTVDWGDFGPCQDCADHNWDDTCPNFVACPQCDEIRDAKQARLAEDLAIAARVRACLDEGYFVRFPEEHPTRGHGTEFPGDLLAYLLDGTEERGA